MNLDRSNKEDFYYTKDGHLVFTESYHKKRGYCCKSGCRHCPYGFKKNSKRICKLNQDYDICSPFQKSE